MTNISKKVSKFFTLNFYESKEYIFREFDDSVFDVFVAQKGLEKIYRNKNFSETEKNDLINSLQKKMPVHYKTINDIYNFIKTFIPIGDKILLNLKNNITLNFNNSLATFYYCLGKYVFENPDTIATAKNILIDIAKKSLCDDLESINYSLSISMDTIYIKVKSVLEYMYSEATKYGVLIEKYDAISFGREYIESIDSYSIVPRLYLKLANISFEKGLKIGSKYHNNIIKKRHKEEAGPIESYYKCTLCKYCTILQIEADVKELAFELLHRQFSNRNQTDLFYFYTGDFQSYILSVLTYLYSRLLILLLFSEKTMELIEKEDIKKNMLWGDKIKDEIFDECYRLISNDKKFQQIFNVIPKGILLGKWQFDNNFSIIELSKNISLNSQSSSWTGKNSNIFGKQIYEKIVRDILSDDKWCVIPHSIKLKANQCTKTDVDLVAYKNGIIIIGQIKLANCGRSEYEIWKTRKTLNKAAFQLEIALKSFSNDKNLLFSILKKNQFCKSKNDILKVVPIIITSSSYFIGEFDCSKIPIVSWDMFCQIIHSINYFENLEMIDSYFENVCLVFDCGENQLIESRIETSEYCIQYEEFE